MRKTIRVASITAGVTLLLVLGRITPAFAQGGDGGKIDQPTFNPEAPGVEGMDELGSTLVTWILVGCLIAFLISLLLIPLGNALGMSQVSQGAKIGAIVAIAVAFLVGSAAAFINWAYSSGGGK